MKKLLLLIFALASTLGFAQTQVAPFLTPSPQFFDNNGNPLTGGKVCFFAAGTTTPQATYSESTGTTLNSNPVILNSAGFPNSGAIFLTTAAYKIVTSASTANSQCSPAISTVDNVTWQNQSSVLASLTVTGSSIVKPSTPATSLTNQSSPTWCLQGFYFNVTSLTDQFCMSDILGSGPTPTATWTVTHSGSGGTVSINLPQVAVTFGNTSAPAFIDSVGTPATAGLVRLQNLDQECWRNFAATGNVCDSDAGAAAAGTGNLADLFKWTGGGAQFAAYVDQSAAPANSGVVRTGNNVAAVVARNAAGSADVVAVQVDANNIADLGGTAGVKIIGPIATASGSLALPSTTGTLAIGNPAFQKFTGSGTFTIPPGVTAVKVTIIGSGGAGGGATSILTGAGGGSGGIAIKILTGLTPGNTLAVTVGAAGAAASGAIGGNGNPSTVASGTQTIATITANGGIGGQTSTSIPGPGGGAAISTGGDINGGGTPAQFVTTASTFGGAGGATMLGGAGGFAAGSSAGVAAVANTGSGGGGAGVGATNAGGNGGAGLVLFEWVQ